MDEPLKPMDGTDAVSQAQIRSQRRMAIGCFVGIFAMVLVVLFPLMVVPRVVGEKAGPLSNIRQSTLATLLYASDHDDRLPIAAHWMDMAAKRVPNKSVLKSPDLSDANAFGFAFRSKFSSASLPGIVDPEKVVLIFDSTDTKWDANGGLELLPSPGRHAGKNAIAFVDGRVMMLPDGTPGLQ